MKWLTGITLAAGFGLAPHLAAGDSNTNLDAVPQWTVPAPWKELAPGPAMVKAYSPAPGVTNPVFVTVQRLPNRVHRERAPLALPSFEMTGDGRKPIRRPVELADPHDRATMLDMEGMDSQTFASRRQIVIKVLRKEEQEEWIYKIIGDTKVVTPQKDAFIKFVQSAHYPNASK